MKTRLYSYEPNQYFRPSLVHWAIVKETPKGYWIVRETHLPYIKDKVLPYWLKRHWVSKSGRKRRAYPTEAEAFTSYLAKSEAYVKHCERRLHNAKRRLNSATNMVEVENGNS